MFLRDVVAGQVVDLSHPLTSDMPTFPDTPSFRLVPYYRYGDYKFANGYSDFNEVLTLSGHSGTHIDALGHVSKHGVVHGGYPAAESMDGIKGLTRNGVDSIPPIVARGVFIDAVRLLGRDFKNDDHVDVAMLERFQRETGVTIQAGDVVVVRTGWAKHWSSPADYLAFEIGTPGIDIGAAVWLAEHGVTAVGADTGAVECIPADDLDLPVHLELLVERGIYLIENLNLEQLASSPATTFLFVCLPLVIPGASGSSVRPIAVLENQTI